MQRRPHGRQTWMRLSRRAQHKRPDGEAVGQQLHGAACRSVDADDRVAAAKLPGVDACSELTRQRQIRGARDSSIECRATQHQHDRAGRDMPIDRPRSVMDSPGQLRVTQPGDGSMTPEGLRRIEVIEIQPSLQARRIEAAAHAAD